MFGATGKFAPVIISHLQGVPVPDIPTMTNDLLTHQENYTPVLNELNGKINSSLEEPINRGIFLQQNANRLVASCIVRADAGPEVQEVFNGINTLFASSNIVLSDDPDREFRDQLVGDTLNECPNLGQAYFNKLQQSRLNLTNEQDRQSIYNLYRLYKNSNSDDQIDFLKLAEVFVDNFGANPTYQQYEEVLIITASIKTLGVIKYLLIEHRVMVLLGLQNYVSNYKPLWKKGGINEFFQAVNFKFSVKICINRIRTHSYVYIQNIQMFVNTNRAAVSNYIQNINHQQMRTILTTGGVFTLIMGNLYKNGKISTNVPSLRDLTVASPPKIGDEAVTNARNMSEFLGRIGAAVWGGVTGGFVGEATKHALQVFCKVIDENQQEFAKIMAFIRGMKGQ